MRYPLAGVGGAVFYGGPPAGPPQGGQPGFGGPPSGGAPTPGASWQQPNRPSSGSNKGVLIAAGGVLATLIVLAGAVLFFSLRDDSDEEEINEVASPAVEVDPLTEPAEPEPVEEEPLVTDTVPTEETVVPEPTQAVEDGDFPLTLEEVPSLPSNATAVTTALDGIIGGYCDEGVSSIGLIEAAELEFEAVPLPSVGPARLDQNVLEFNNAANARLYFDDIVADNRCGTSQYNRGSNDTFTSTIRIESPTIYGDDTFEVSVNAIGDQTGRQAFFAREFILLDENYVYYIELTGFQEFPREDLTILLDQSATNLGLR